MSLSSRRLPITLFAALGFAAGCAQAVPANSGGDPDAHVITSVPDAHVITNQPDAQVITNPPDAHTQTFADANQQQNFPDANQQQGNQHTLTETTSDSVVTGSSVACPSELGDGSTAAAGYYRAYVLSDFNITSSFAVTSVSFGVESAAAADGSGSQQVQINLYSYSGNPTTTLSSSSVTAQLGTAMADVSDTTGGETVNATIAGTVPAGGTLLVEILTTDGDTTDDQFYIGSNTSGETRSGYLVASDCGTTTPTDINPDIVTAAGVPNMDIIIDVNGN